MEIINKKYFGNGAVYALRTKSGKVIETTDTFLPMYTRDAVGRRKNTLISKDFGLRRERWMIGISTMSGCPIGCKFCATGGKFLGNLTAEEMVEQVEFILGLNPEFDPMKAKEFRVLTTRMGEPAMNYLELNKAIEILGVKFPNVEIAISTIGLENPALESWLKLSERFKIALQFSVHSTSKEYRDWLIPHANKLSFEDIKEFAEKWMEKNDRKVSLNFTLTNESEFDVEKLERYFPKELFFIKLSPINENYVTQINGLKGQINVKNLV